MGTETVDVTDWRIKDDGFDCVFNDGEGLDAGEQFRINIGSGTDNGADRYWGNSSRILNIGDQSLEIWTLQSQKVDSCAWGTGTSIDENPRGAIPMFANYNAAGNDLTNPSGEWGSL